MSNLQGKVAVITGGSSGIGLATAKRFVREGAYVFITGRRQSELDKAVADIGGNVTAVQGDVANLADLDRLYAAVKAEKGVVDIVVANAGFIEHAQISDLSEAHYDKTLDINLKGVVFTVQKALPLMTRGGAIVAISSCVNEMGIPAHGTYSAAKAAVRSLVRVWTSELKDRGIRANALSPGATEISDHPRPVPQRRRGGGRQGHVRLQDPARSPRAARGNRRRRLLPGLRRVRASSRASISPSMAASPRSEPVGDAAQIPLYR